MNKFSKDNQTGDNHLGAHPNNPVKFLTATSIIGDKVTNPKKENLGSINNIMIDVEKGKIEYVIMELGGFLGIGEKFFAIPFNLLKLDSINQVFILDQRKETLEEAPGFNKEHWPETNAHMLEPTNVYWNGLFEGNTAMR
jgi:sporulation protein YlmC with PRC-barrel domain